MVSDDARGVVRKSEDALADHPEVAQSKRSCSPAPAQLVGRTEIPRLALPAGLAEPVRREAAGSAPMAAASSSGGVGENSPDIAA
eukprot:2362785-Alexandrium_andersonii.AAC.1